MRASASDAIAATDLLEGTIKEGTDEEREWLLGVIVKACPNISVVARGLRMSLEGWEREEVARLLWDLLGPEGEEETCGPVRKDEVEK